MPGIGGDGEQRLGSGLEQGVVDRLLVGVGDVRDRRRQREDDMIVGDRQQLGAAGFEPIVSGGGLTLRAMAVAAGIVRHIDVRAVFAAAHVAAERGRAAALDRLHHALLREAEPPRMGAAIGDRSGYRERRLASSVRVPSAEDLSFTPNVGADEVAALCGGQPCVALGPLEHHPEFTFILERAG
jgi:hypothetical protein